MMRNRNNSIVRQIFLVTFSFILGGVVMICLLRFNSSLDGLIGSNTSTTITNNGTKVYEKGSLSASIDKIYDAVVTIECYKNNQLNSTGSGFIYKVEGNYAYIMTNQHVVSGQKNVKILFNSKDEEIDAEILGGDEYLDLAVLRIEKKYATMIANIGSSEKMNLGDTIFTVGAPMGVDYKGTVTSGILSGKDRMVSVSVGNSSSNDWVMRVLQIDASINPGNSGGPLVNINGEVIGICSMKLVDNEIEGMGFAIPIEYAMNHVEKLEKGKKIEWPVLGISMINVTDTANLSKNGISIDKKYTKGVVILEVSKNTAADRAGIKNKDIIIKVDEHKINDIANLRYYLYQHSVGETMKLTIIRNGKEEVINVKL